ncbi:Indoleamine 2,3-dioxygenase [Lithohypha guttulata]|uniref:Indoleamine 2,3-dioxygenase n=1 Tax=Lithohypha guttulata TaxID=1690604 RepID=UPI002DE01C7D|nr:tryptophan 2,3- dioxygenase [Lithohypha guttulata]
MFDSIDRILHSFEISHYGFLPVDEPLARLPSTYYQPWENLISRLPILISDGSLYNEFASLPLLSTSELRSLPEWRRAYVILTFFTHAHTWSDLQPREVLPANITVPLLEVSAYLDLPPTATYPALNLWNCGLVTDGADITNPENVVMRHTFTGTTDEAWFYAVSVSVEAKGVAAIQVMLECVKAIEQDKKDEVLECLRSFRVIVSELASILQRMHEHCDPSVFYHRIRPFLAGSRGMEKAGLPHGLFYDEGRGKGSWRQYSGGSNAQSSLIQFLDIALGIKHEGPSSQRGGKEQAYLNGMRQYMPQAHRQFLEYFDSVAKIRQYVQSKNVSETLSSTFDEAVEAMAAFRDTHIKIVARYIVAPSRARDQSQNQGVRNIAASSSEQTSSKDELKGTGGTNLMAFLKQTRAETRAAKSRTPIAV